MPDKRSGELQLAAVDAADEHFGLQRIAWAVMAALVLLALAGAFGGGWLAQAQVAAADGSLTLDYDRVLRADAPTQLRLTLSRSASAGEIAELTLPSGYLEQIQVDAIVPPPLRARSGPDGITYAFGIASDGAPVAVVLSVTPRRAGLVHPSVALAGGPPVAFRQLILP